MSTTRTHPSDVGTAALVRGMHELRHDVRADFEAGKTHRLMKRRVGLGGSADAHYTNASQYDRMRESARDMERNEPILAAFTDRAVVAQIQNGFIPEPDTGDETLNTDLKARWHDWVDDSGQCDFHHERTFYEQIHDCLYRTYIDGDIFAVLTDAGSIQWLEAERCASPTKRDARDATIVHGVELQGRRKVAFWFTRDPGTQRLASLKVDRRERFDEGGLPAVLHHYNPQTVRRFTQSRGVTAYSPVFLRLNYHEDGEFAALVRQQVIAAVALFFERGPDYTAGKTNLGPRSTQADDDSNTRTLEALAPGTVLRGAKGEKASILSANIPSEGWFNLTKLILTEIGINIGVPLVLGLMDAGETNFSGWRGAIDMAKMGFRRNQHFSRARILRPVYLWKIRQWINDRLFPDDPATFVHAWSLPTWPYIQPLHDAQANALRFQTGQLSPKEWARDVLGGDWEDHCTEIVGGWSHLIEMALTRAAELNKKFPAANVHWRDVCHLGTPDGLTLSGALKPQDESSGQSGARKPQPQETANAR